MADATSAYRLCGAIGAAATAVMILALVVAIDALAFHLVGGAALDAPLLALLAIGAGSLTLAAFALALHSTTRHVRAVRRLRRAARHMQRRVVDGTEVLVYESHAPAAFCAGLGRPQVYVSSGALAVLGQRELQAVIAHEREHARRRDPLRLLGLATLRGVLFFAPGVDKLASRCGRLAELAADEAAERRAGRQPLAAALLALGSGVSAERVDRLTGVPVSPGSARGQLLPLTVPLVALSAVTGAIAAMTGCLDLDVGLLAQDPQRGVVAVALAACGSAALLGARRVVN